jgi:UDP-GlcNAc:undecaprenyl-phosphate/decaprenyl-phosphate GlcNAc-1-phosphate transferase
MQLADTIKYLTPLVTAVAISMALIPLMVRFAPRLGLIDRPNARKVHAEPIPRVGGIGIISGALISIGLLVPMDPLITSYIIGALILFVFGVWDDRREIGHYVKFIGQFAAALVVVVYGGLYVHSFPFMADTELPAAFGMPFSVIAIMGMINAINHSDGLDGLAGGESLISLAGIAFLAYHAGGDTGMFIALALIGGIFGFLRYNTHPARVFMGDSGSQFLGFSLAFLVILLSQRIDQSLSPAAVLLLLGLPVIDIIAVLVIRIRSGMNWFRASRNHIHHRLLDLGFVHEESVIIIYSVQVICVTLGVLLCREPDWLIVTIYLLLCVGFLMLITLAERLGWRRMPVAEDGAAIASIKHVNARNLLVVAPRRFLAIGIPVYLMGTSLLIERVPRDFAAMSGLIFTLMILEVSFGKDPRSIMRRALIYITAVFVVFLGINHPPDIATIGEPFVALFFVLVALSFAVAVKFSPRRRRVEFKTTAMDYLVLAVLLGSFVASKGLILGDMAMIFAVEIIVIFYACELLVTENRERWNGLSAAALVTALILAVRGLL